MFFDAEYAWSLYGNRPDADTLRDLLSGTHMSGESKALIALLAREDMREKFAATMSDLTANAFEKGSTILETLDELCAMSDSEQFYALDKGITSEWANRETFANSRQQIRDFADIREYVVFR